jgi:hypothetical protein
MNTKLVLLTFISVISAAAKADEKLIVRCVAHDRRIDIVDVDQARGQTRDQARNQTREFRYYFQDELEVTNPDAQTTSDDDGGVTFRVLGDKLHVKDDAGYFVGIWPHPPKLVQILMQCQEQN